MGERVPPDGGCLAWMIVVASFMVSFLQDGFRDSFGLLLNDMSLFYSVGRAPAAMTSSLMTFMTLGSGPLAAWLLTRWGHRTVTLVGTLLAAAGLVAAGVGVHFQVMNIGLLYITVGVITGLGFGLMYLPAMDIVEIYFSANLGVATGLAAAGSGVGQFVMAPVIHEINQTFKLEGSLFSMGGLVLIAICFTFLYKTPKEEQNEELIGDVTPAWTNSTIDFVNLDIIKNSNHETFQDVNANNGKKRKLAGFWDKFKRSKTLILLRNPAMIVLLISHFFMHLGIFAAFSLTADRAQIVLGFTEHTSSILYSIMGIANCFGRVIFGKLLDIYRTKVFFLTTSILILNASAVIFSDFLPTFTGQAVYCAIFGATFGAYISSVVVVLKYIYDDITEMLGVCLFVFAVASLIGPALVGHLFDIFGSYRIGFLIVGGLGFFGAGLLPVAYKLQPSKKLVITSYQQTISPMPSLMVQRF